MIDGKFKRKRREKAITQRSEGCRVKIQAIKEKKIEGCKEIMNCKIISRYRFSLNSARIKIKKKGDLQPEKSASEAYLTRPH